MKNILDLNLIELKKWMKDNGETEFRAKQVFEWLYKGCLSFGEMKNIPASLKAKLEAGFDTGIPEIVERRKSRADDTVKFLMKYSDGNVIEAVVMKYRHGNSICVSTQIGCRMGCSFCASTLNGMVRNLTSGEIVGQIIAAQRDTGGRISNVVLMGSGEPLDNFDNVTRFLDTVNADYGLNIGQRHITLSTCGIVPRMRELADMNYQITLAVSLHAPNDEIRRQMMPVANKYSMAEIIDACRYYINRTNRRITFEYSLVKGKNDSIANAQELAELLKGMLCHVNLIPVNAVVEKGYAKPDDEDIAAFCSILTKKGIETTVRREMGSDIDAACGQLRRSYLDERRGE